VRIGSVSCRVVVVENVKRDGCGWDGRKRKTSCVPVPRPALSLTHLLSRLAPRSSPDHHQQHDLVKVSGDF